MTEEDNRAVMHPAFARWVPYAVKAIAAFAVIFFVTRALPVMPPLCVGICWAVMSAAVSLGIAYPYVIRKLLNRYEYEPGGHLSRYNEGRVLRLLISTVLAAVLVAALMLEAVKWGALEWAIAALAIPLFPAFSALLRRLIEKEFREKFRVARTIQASRVFATIALGIIYMLVITQLSVTSYSNAAEAFLAASNPLETSPSALLSELGKYTALIDGLYAFATSKVAQGSFAFYVVLKVVLSASSLYSINAVMLVEEGFADYIARCSNRTLR